jgi:hypothetical protein
MKNLILAVAMAACLAGCEFHGVGKEYITSNYDTEVYRGNVIFQYPTGQYITHVGVFYFVAKDGNKYYWDQSGGRWIGQYGYYDSNGYHST